MMWNVSVTAHDNPLIAAQELLIVVKVPYAVLHLLRGKNFQHGLVDYIARTLHKFVEIEFSAKRLTP